MFFHHAASLMEKKYIDTLASLALRYDVALLKIIL